MQKIEGCEGEQFGLVTLVNQEKLAEEDSIPTQKRKALIKNNNNNNNIIIIIIIISHSCHCWQMASMVKSIKQLSIEKFSIEGCLCFLPYSYFMLQGLVFSM